MLAEIVGGLVLAVLLLYIFFEWNVSHMKDLADRIPGPKRVPIIGSTLVFSMPGNGAGMLDLRRNLIKQYGHTTQFWIGNLLYVVISDPQDVEVILNKTTDLKKDQMYKYFKPWLGEGLLISSGQKWYARRKAITPAFHFKILEGFVDTFNKNGEILTKHLKKEEGKNTFDVQPYICRYALDVICETAMGVEVHAQENASSPYVLTVRRIMRQLFERMRSPLQWNHYYYLLTGKKSKEDEMVKTIHNFSNKVIQEKKKENVEITVDENDSFTGIKNKTAFLELLLNLSNKPNSVIKTDEDIREEVDTFMFEGHDTTTSALSSLIHFLGKHQDVQDKVYAEVKQVMENKDCMNPTYQDLQEMKYMECVIKEAMRLFPPVPAIARDLKEDIRLASGHLAPKGSVALISLFFLHRNDKYFSNPDEFNPDNFLPENSVGRHPYAYAPFSAGQRNCIGQKFAMLEIKSTLVKLLTKYKVVYPGSEWDIIPNPTLTLQSVNGFHIKLATRDS